MEEKRSKMKNLCFFYSIQDHYQIHLSLNINSFDIFLYDGDDDNDDNDSDDNDNDERLAKRRSRRSRLVRHTLTMCVSVCLL